MRPLRQWILREHRGDPDASFLRKLEELEVRYDIRTSQRPLTWDELLSMENDPSISFGLHTHSHCVLPLLSDDDIREEIARCLRECQARLRSVAPLLAFPYGFFDARTIRVAISAECLSFLSLGPGTTDAPVFLRIPIGAGARPWKVKVRATGWPDRMRRSRERRADGSPVLPTETS